MKTLQLLSMLAVVLAGCSNRVRSTSEQVEGPQEETRRSASVASMPKKSGIVKYKDGAERRFSSIIGLVFAPSVESSESFISVSDWLVFAVPGEQGTFQKFNRGHRFVPHWEINQVVFGDEFFSEGAFGSSSKVRLVGRESETEFTCGCAYFGIKWEDSIDADTVRVYALSEFEDDTRLYQVVLNNSEKDNLAGATIVFDQ